MSYLIAHYEVKLAQADLIADLNAQLVARGFQKASSGGETSLFWNCGTGVSSESAIEQVQRIFEEVLRRYQYELTLVPSETPDTRIYRKRNFPF